MKLVDDSRVADRLAGAGLAEVQDGQPMVGHIRWALVDPLSGAVVDSGEVHNLVVTTGKNLMASLWSGAAVSPPTHVAIGSGNTAEAVAQAALVAETARVALSTRTSAANVTTVVGTIPAGTGTGAVEEVALFNAAAGGTMTQRALTGTITKPAGLGLQFTWTTTFN